MRPCSEKVSSNFLILETKTAIFITLATSYVNDQITDFFDKHKDQSANLLMLELLMGVEEFRKAAKADAKATAEKVNTFANRTNLRLENPVTAEEVQRTAEYDIPAGRRLKDVLVKPAFAAVLYPVENVYFHREENPISAENFLIRLAEAVLDSSLTEGMTTKLKVLHRLIFVFGVTLQREVVGLQSSLKPITDKSNKPRKTALFPGSSQNPKQKPEKSIRKTRKCM